MSEYTLNAYQNDALQFRVAGGALPLYPVLNLPGEVGELMSLMAKAVRDGKQLDYDQNVKKELGDILWMVAAIAIDHGFTLEDVAATNVYKLTDRAKRNMLQGSGDNR